MKLLIINNLASGYGDGAVYDFVRVFLKDGDEACIRCTDGTTDIANMLGDASNFDAVVAAGGDGTVTAVAYTLAYSKVPILPLPVGTANLLANNLSSPYEPPALAKMPRMMNVVDFDLGEIEAEGVKHGFGVMAGAGYDATIMHDAKPAKKLLGPIAYFKAAAMNVLPQVSKIRFSIDDGPVQECDGLGVLLVNFSKIQFDIAVTHGNDPCDGMLDVVILKTETAFGLIPVLIAGILDREGDYPNRSDSLDIHRGKKVHVEADPPMHIQFDGEYPELETPFDARILPGAGRFILSEAGFEHFSRSRKSS